MKELLNELKGDIAGYGYKKSGNSFWKIENGFYKLIDFQGGCPRRLFLYQCGPSSCGFSISHYRKTGDKGKTTGARVHHTPEDRRNCAAGTVSESIVAYP